MFLLRVRPDQARVQIDDQRVRGVHPVIGGVGTGLQPCGGAARRPGGVDRRQRLRRILGQSRDQPGHRRIGGHRTEDPRLLPQQCEIGQAVPTHRDRHRQVQQDFPGSCVAKGLRHGANATERAPPNPVFSAVRSNITAPAWDTTPIPVVSTDNDG